MAVLPTPQKTIKTPKYGLSTVKSRFCHKDTNFRPLGSSGRVLGEVRSLLQKGFGFRVRGAGHEHAHSAGLRPLQDT